MRETALRCAHEPDPDPWREEDGRWIVEVPELPGVMTYGATREEAMAKAEVLARRITSSAHDVSP